PSIAHQRPREYSSSRELTAESARVCFRLVRLAGYRRSLRSRAYAGCISRANRGNNQGERNTHGTFMENQTVAQSPDGNRTRRGACPLHWRRAVGEEFRPIDVRTARF